MSCGVQAVRAGAWLHSRSRGLHPTSVGLLGLAVAAPLGARWIGTADPAADVMHLLAVTAGTALVGPGLAGADPDLEASTPRDRALLRLVHLGVALVAVIAVLVIGRGLLQPSAAERGDLLVLTRTAAGLAGLQLLAAATMGTRLCWAPPTLWVLAVLTAGPGEHGLRLIASMPLLPAGSAVAAYTAAVLLLVGAAAYSRRGAPA